MKTLLIPVLLSVFAAFPARAAEVGLNFGDMPVGTRLVTETRGDDPVRYAETYTGMKDGFHIVRLTKVKIDGTEPLLVTRFFDAKGRLVRAEKEGKLSSRSTPFSCEYVLGPCEHTYVYANPFRNGKLVTHEDTYKNRLDGQTLTVAQQLSDGSYLEIPYELGDYNLRISSEYTNKLGQVRGFRLVDLIEP